MAGARVPRSGSYRGIELYAGQDDERLKNITRPAIDFALDQLGTDIADLYLYAANRDHPPEARLIASARAAAIWELSVEARLRRPGISTEMIRATTCALDDSTWFDRENWYSDLCPPFSAVAYGKR